MVAKLFSLARPDDAYFGQKDVQQVAIVKRMVADLNLPPEIHPLPIQRGVDGLAESSRNQHLTSAQLEAALALLRALKALKSPALLTTCFCRGRPRSQNAASVGEKPDFSQI